MSEFREALELARGTIAVVVGVTAGELDALDRAEDVDRLEKLSSELDAALEEGLGALRVNLERRFGDALSEVWIAPARIDDRAADRPGSARELRDESPTSTELER